MNASVHLLHRALRTTVQVRSEVPSTHPSAGILGTERVGAGTVIEPSGHVLTAHYLVLGAQTVELTPPEGESLPGRVLSVDHGTGLALVDVSGARLPGLKVRQTAEDVVGEEAFLIAAHEDGRRVSNGVITSYAPFEAFWEYMVDHALTCSAASPGLGGGPLVDARGEMLGVVSLSLAEVGKFTLAVPACRATDMLEQVEAKGTYVNEHPHAWLGVTCYPVGSNLIIAAVLPETPAESSGLESGDVVVNVGGHAVSDRRSFYSEIWKSAPGSTVRLAVKRGDEILEVAIEASSIEEYFGS